MTTLGTGSLDRALGSRRSRSFTGLALALGLLVACGEPAPRAEAAGGDSGAQTAAAARLHWGDVEIAILGWEAVASPPRGVSLRPGERLVGVDYLAVNRGERATSFSARELRLRDGSGQDHRVSTTATSLLGEGSLGGVLMPGEPLRGVAFYQVPATGALAVVFSPRRDEETKIPLAPQPGASAPPADLVAAARPETTAPGETAEIEGWGVRVVAAHPVEAIGNVRPEAGDEALAVEVELTNRGAEARRIAPASQTRLKDASGRVFGYQGDPEPGSGARAAQATLHGGLLGGVEAAPGATVQRSLGFLVPADAEGLVLLVDPVATERGLAILRLP